MANTLITIVMLVTIFIIILNLLSFLYFSQKLEDLVYAIKQKYIEREVLDKIKAEIMEWYWQADKQELAKDPCVVDAMVDLFIRTINKYKAESEE